MRRGLTLIEALVALVLLEVGMLALAATSAVAARDYAFAQRSRRAQSLAVNRLEALVAAACSGETADSLTVDGGYVVSWRVHGVGARRGINVAVRFPLASTRTGVVSLESATLCRP